MKLPRAIFLAGAIPFLAGTGFLLLPRFADGRADSAAPLITPNSAFGFILAGAAVMLLTRRTQMARRLVLGLAGLLAFAALGRMAMDFAGGWAGTGEFFVAAAHGAETRRPEFVPAIAFGFFLIAIALALLAWRGRVRAGDALAASLAVAVGVVGQWFVGRFVLGVQSDPALFAPALVRSALFALIALGLFGAAFFEPAASEPESFAAGREPFPPDKRLSLAFGTTLGLILLGGLLSYELVARFADDNRRADQTYRWLGALGALRSALDAAEAGAHDYLATGRDDELRSYRLAIDRFEAPLRGVLHFSADPAQLAPLNRVAPAIKTELSQLQAAVEARRAGRDAPARLAATGARGEISAAISVMENAARRDLAVRAARGESIRRRAAFAFAAAVCAVGAILLGAHFVFERDLAARRRADVALRRHNETLRSFAHTVAHDLRAPLRGIAGYARELELHAPSLDDRGRHDVKQIHAAARHLEQLIEDTLDYARLDAETPRLVPIDLPVLVAALLRQRAPQIQEYGAEIATHFGVATIVSWEHGLAQVLGNLLDNALKYSRHARPPQLRIESAETPVAWRLLVCDNGVGFDMKHHDRIFGLFQRLVTANEFEGTGAGLAIVKKITDRLGGTVRAEARPGGGATFLVELPKTSADELA